MRLIAGWQINFRICIVVPELSLKSLLPSLKALLLCLCNWTLFFFFFILNIGIWLCNFLKRNKKHLWIKISYLKKRVINKIHHKSYFSEICERKKKNSSENKNNNLVCLFHDFLFSWENISLKAVHSYLNFELACFAFEWDIAYFCIYYV